MCCYISNVEDREKTYFKKQMYLVQMNFPSSYSLEILIQSVFALIQV